MSRLNTCSVCDHYNWVHNETGCPAMIWIKDRGTFEKCSCTKTYKDLMGDSPILSDGEPSAYTSRSSDDSEHQKT